MRFLAITLIAHRPDPVTGELKSTRARFREVLDNAVLAEELGFDGFGVGERHERPFISSSPPVVLSHIAALTRRIRLFTAVTTLSLLDPVRAHEDYATLDHLSGGRLELIIGKGNGAAQRDLFHVTPEDQWDRNAESYEVFRRLWREDRVTARTRFRPELTDAEVWPRPYQQPVRVWHGSATSRESVDLAARYGDPLFSANVTHPVEPYAELIDHYRERWAHYGHDPADLGGVVWILSGSRGLARASAALSSVARAPPCRPPPPCSCTHQTPLGWATRHCCLEPTRSKRHPLAVGAGTAGLYVARTSQQALDGYRPVFESNLAFRRETGLPVVFETLEDFVARSSALIGSPQQVIEKVHRYHQRFGHTVTHLHADASGLDATEHRRSLELFQSEVAPGLRRDLPDPPFAWGPVSPAAEPQPAGL
ncbi:LLM class flavin-dependent oxidoreductase [Streptomyces olivaceus]|uniref:LLM class flavin-dependent oxidoreductase n=1 Tax=Streptomyces olivaceus TaxID=47716 RepID=UPI0009A025E3|nr:LLM class flavin-dependent oxidoreductase [Streptomyces olivaceus]MBZ6304389.1 LLM class flavin-dependent oxidoreductase [Streptomyces olivaceus]GHI98587.1 hypothetical protein TPA0906_04530 [Streptomyces olivaceus]